MSQGTLQVANQGFPGVRTDLNAALAALNSKNSGTTAPSLIAAGQSWLDTSVGTNPVLKQSDGSDWISVTQFDTNTNTSRPFVGTQAFVYEEGSWTPRIGGNGTAGTQTYSVQVGRYIRKGSEITAWGRAVMTAKDPATSGGISVLDLPYPLSNVSNLLPPLKFGEASYINSPAAGLSQFSGFGVNNTSRADLYMLGTSANSRALPVASLTGTTAITFEIIYRTG